METDQMTLQFTHFGERVRALREEEGVSLRRVAARARITPTHLMCVERGESVPTLGVAERIANAVDSSVGSLLHEEELG
jgi:transcriptional regulator with XRE-family HTH domain